MGVIGQSGKLMLILKTLMLLILKILMLMLMLMLMFRISVRPTKLRKSWNYTVYFHTWTWNLVTGNHLVWINFVQFVSVWFGLLWLDLVALKLN